MAGFLPNADAALLAWSLNFSTRITATPTAYGLTAALATAYSTAHTSFATALAGCDPSERSKVATEAKNQARTNLKTQARLLAKLVEGTATVTNAQKLELGLNVRAQPTPIPAPSVSPGIDIVSVSGRSVRLRLHDATTPRRRKPAGVKGASVFSFIGTTPPGEAAGWTFEGSTTENVFDITFPEGTAPGTTVWMTAFWFNPTAQSGPAAEPISTMVQFGSMQMLVSSTERKRKAA